MEELCYIDGCPGSGKFGCSCNDSLRVCQVHIAEHTCSFGYHEISSISFGITNQKIKDAIKSLNKLNTSTLKKSKEMFQELCNKLCDVVENLSQRQQCLFELSSSSCSQEIDKKIKELEQVNITFRNKKDFRKVLDNFMSSGEEIFENSSLDEFRKDFRIIIESLGKSNEVLQTVFDSQKVEKVFKEHLETRISSLEQKNSNFDEKLKILDQNTKICSSNLENFKKEIEKSNKSSKEIERMFKEKMIETRRNGKQLVDKIEALEISVTTSVHQSMKLLNEKNDDLGEKFCKIKDIKDPGFKGVLEGFFNEIYLRRIELENEEVRRKQEAEEVAKIHPEKRKVDAMSITQKINYYYPSFSQLSLWGGSLDACLSAISQLILSNDGKYLFHCISYSDRIKY